MPYYSFDLVVGEECKHQGGLILENLDFASDRAEQLADELRVVLPEELRDPGDRRASDRALSHAARSGTVMDAAP